MILGDWATVGKGGAIVLSELASRVVEGARHSAPSPANDRSV